MSGGWSKDYNRAERLLWQNPKHILSRIGLKAGDTLADIGCGDGFFSLPAAKIVGATGLIYAVDTDAKAIAALTAAVQAEGISNINPLLADIETSLPHVHCADIALLANVLHAFNHPLKTLSVVKQLLKPNGILADLDWKREPQQLHGPPITKRLGQEEATDYLQQAGFRVASAAPCGPYHYLILAVMG